MFFENVVLYSFTKATKAVFFNIMKKLHLCDRAEKGRDFFVKLITFIFF